MLTNYLKIALRNLSKQPGYTSINLIGLAVGLACCLHILLFVQDELSYDRFHEQADRIYRLTLEGQFAGNEVKAPVTPSPMARTLVSDFPEVVTATRIFPFAGQRIVRRDDRTFIEEGIYFVDSTFFDVFSFPLVQGNPQTALAAPDAVVLTETMARKYFGVDDPMNRTLVVSDTTTYRVTGVVADVPANSHIQFDFLAPIASFPAIENDRWVSNNFYCYFVAAEGFDAGAFEAGLPAFFERYAGPQIYEALGLQYDEFTAAGNALRYHLQRITDVHLHSHFQFELTPNGDVAYVYLFIAIAVFILFLACINFMNLATARSARRAREIGMRKVMGATRPQLIRQFLAESTLLSFMALLLAFGLVLLLLPAFNDLSGKAVSAAYLVRPSVLAGLVGLAVLVGLVAGSYPAFFLSAFRPAAVLKGSPDVGKRRSWLRNGLVVFQFAISIGLIAGTVVVYDQLTYVRSKNLGFDQEHVVVIERAQDLGDQAEAFKDALRAYSGVVNVAGATSMPGGQYAQTAYIPEGASAATETYIMSPLFVDYDFVETLGIEVAEGRAYDRDFPSDSMMLLLNETAVRTLGWEDPIGKTLRRVGATPDQAVASEVIGVLKDFHFASLRQEIGSLVLHMADFPLPTLAVRVRPDDLPGTLAFLEKQWRAFAPEQPFDYSFLDQDFDAQYAAEQKLGKIFTSFAVFAILIACLGLLGLASYTAEQRRKEIGVRKVMGASVLQIIFLFSKEFTWLVLIALVVAAPAAYFAMQRWLQDFAYPTSIGIGTFVLAGALALAIAWLTVGYQSVKAALANPVDSLRYE